jgi:hypothetical protein
MVIGGNGNSEAANCESVCSLFLSLRKDSIDVASSSG